MDQEIRKKKWHWKLSAPFCHSLSAWGVVLYCQEKLSIWLFFIFCFAWDKLYDKVSVENVMLMNVFFFIWYTWCFRPKKTVFLSVYVCFFKSFLFTLRNRKRQLNSCLFLWDSLRFLSCITYWYHFRYFTESLIL